MKRSFVFCLAAALLLSTAHRASAPISEESPTPVPEQSAKPRIKHSVKPVASEQSAPQQKEARVTQVFKDVRLLASKGAPRPASVNDSVNEGSAVQTGEDSRAELTFTDQTLTRLGANTVFSFGANGRDVDLSSGAILLAAPQNTGTTKVKMGVATAAVSGFAALFETHPNALSKIILLDGEGTVSIKGVLGSSCHIHSGQMMIIPAHPTECPPASDVDITKLLATAKLITLWPLPHWILDPILTHANK